METRVCHNKTRPRGGFRPTSHGFQPVAPRDLTEPPTRALARADRPCHASRVIISASYRTDIAAYYADWFARRLEAGWCLVGGPFDGKLRRVDLHAAGGFVFWTRHAAPLLPTLARLGADGVPFVVQYTLTDYPRRLESHRPDRAVALATMRTVAERFGPRALVWRYDPVLVSDHTPPEFHRAQFAALAAELRGCCDEVVLSFANLYRKSIRGLTARGVGFEDPSDEAKRALLAELAELAQTAGLRPSLCAQRHLLCEGLSDAACIDALRLGVTARPKPHRSCGCAESVDIGAYDTCPTGCAYCYAVNSRVVASRRRAEHDPADVMLYRPARWRGVAVDELVAASR